MIRAAVLAAAVFAAMPATAACVSLLERDQLVFSGVLRNQVFPGPPNFTDVRRGDVPEPSYILELDAEACAQGDGTIPDGTSFGTVQLYGADQESPVWADLQRLVGRKVDVQGDAAFGAQTGHHHAPVVMAVASVRAAAAASAPADVTGTPGTARTAVEAFYAALAAGNGEEASQWVVPEKRSSGPFSAAEISRFYGAMTEPLQLQAIRPLGPRRFRVSYTYLKGSRGRCRGDAVVTTTRVGRADLIAGIRALGGC